MGTNGAQPSFEKYGRSKHSKKSDKQQERTRDHDQPDKTKGLASTMQQRHEKPSKSKQNKAIPEQVQPDSASLLEGTSEQPTNNDIGSTRSTANDSTPIQETPTDTTNPAPKGNREDFKARYESKLASFLAARNADGPNGTRARNRQELIEGRRQKEERRKAHKKELRAKARAEAGLAVEDEKNKNQVEAEAVRLRGGNVGLDAVIPEPDENFTFGRLEGVGDDAAGLGGKKRNPKRDLKSAILVAEKQHARISAFDESKRANVQEKEAWKGAAARVTGEKVKNDASLLKRSLKKKEKGKEKSRQAWEEREKNVAHGIQMKQKKRTENLKKRRPGFEGTFKIAKRRL